MAKVGHQIFDENRGYEGPDRITADRNTAVIWITASCNLKDALTTLQMELEGEQLQLHWKPAPKKKSRNQIVTYGLPPGIDTKGTMCEVLHGLKESKRDLCGGNQFNPAQDIDRNQIEVDKRG
jgi:hypothetical protein